MFNSAILSYPVHWELTTLGKLCLESGGSIQTGPFGSQLHASDYVDVGIPSIMTKNISVEEISTVDIAKVTNEDARRLSKYIVKQGDIVYSRRGDVEKCSIITSNEAGWLCGTGCLKVSFGKKRKIDSRYIHAYLSSPMIREWISRHAIGATMPNLNTAILSAVPVLIPSQKEIEVITKVWRSITDKIILNRQINQTLEKIAHTIFKSWFVDFDPTHAKIAARERWLALHEVIETSSPTCYSAEFDNANQPTQTLEEAMTQAAMAAISGKTPEELEQLSPEQQQNLRNIAALFPDTLVDSDLGEIPEGWLVSPLSVWGDIICGKTPSKKNDEYYGGDIPLVKIPDMHNSMFVTGTSDTLTALGAATQKRKLLPAGSICVSCIATVGKVVITTKECFTNQQINSIVPQKKFFTPYLYFSMLKINDLLHDLASGGSATLNLNTGNFSKIEILKPSFEVLQQHYILVESILKQVLVNQEEQQTLSALRASLLPKLLSGQLQIRDAENPVSDAMA